MNKISIIVPIYNTAQYLSRCIDSLLSQSFTDFELLLVDDGSNDGSDAICDAYAEKDGRIRVFHKENGGVSSARNLGLDNANGEWIYFVDSDDEVLPDGLRILVDCISEKVDMVMGGFVEIDKNGNSLSTEERASLFLSKKQSIITMFYGYGSYYKYMGYMWIRLLRNRIIQEYKLRFDPSVAIKEDTLFLVQYACKSNGTTWQTTIPVYKYYDRADSAMGKALNGYEPRYVDSFYALVKMKHEIEAIFPCWSDAVFVAKQAIMDRYGSVVNSMDAAGVKDEVLKNKLYGEMKREVGPMFLFRVRKKCMKIKMRVIGKK